MPIRNWLYPALVCTASALVACSNTASDVESSDHSEVISDAPRSVVRTVPLDPNGISAPVTFDIPPNTRSVMVVVEGAQTALFALASLKTGGVEQVGIDTTHSQVENLRADYFEEMGPLRSGALSQLIKLGTFAKVVPDAPVQGSVAVAPGPAQLQVMSDATAGDVKVTVLMPEEDGSHTLHVNFITVSDSFYIPQDASFLDEWRAVYAQAGIDIKVNRALAIHGSPLHEITDGTEPAEPPTSQSAKLALLGSSMIKNSDALNIYFVDSMPFNVGGWTLGTPGPIVPSSYYFGVLVAKSDSDAAYAQTLAHEVSHYLGLRHVHDPGVSGTFYPDPIPDTSPDVPNLMDFTASVKTLTPGQIYALRRSPLLK